MTISHTTDPITLLEQLIRFDTTNPPGHEKACIHWIDTLLKGSGFQTSLFAKDPARPNLVARLKGRGEAPPLLLYGHVDVVTVSGQKWRYPPFEGMRADGCVWGRGALDMKGGIAMMLTALLRIQAENFTPAGDLVFAAFSDEEAGGDFGAKFMVREHPEQFKGIRYAIGEFGGFPIHVGNRRFYPIAVGEKQVCWMKARLSGPGGHGSQRVRGTAMAQLGQMLHRLDKKRLPVHITPIVREMIETMATALPRPGGFALSRLLNPLLVNPLLDLLGEKSALFDPLLHNTATVTVVRGGEKTNVIPSEIALEIDGRTLPGFGPDTLISELKKVTGVDPAIEIVRHEPCPSTPDTGWFNTLADILREADPGCVAIPLLLPAVTDARFLSKLGIQTYGFLPMNLPRDFNFNRMIHNADERIPEQCLTFGSDALHKAIQKYNI